MNYRSLIAILIVVLFSTVPSFGQKADRYVPGEILIKLESSPAALRASNALESNGAEILERFPDLGWQRVKIPAGLSVDEAVARYQQIPGVIAVQPNYYYELMATPNDPDFGLSGMYGLTKISAPQAWDLNTGSPNVVVANIDTGVRYTHDDLAANIWTNPGEPATPNGVDDDNNGFIDDYYGWDFRYNDSDPLDQNGHGTHTSGTIGAVGNNMLGVVGV